MKPGIINIIFILSLVGNTAACQAQNKPVLEYFVEDFKQQMSSNWKQYKLTEYFSKKENKHKYLEKTFDKSITGDAIIIKSRQINISQLDDLEGGFDLGLLLIKYKNEKTLSKNLQKIKSSPKKNLMGKKVFIGYTAVHCDENIIIISSPAILSPEIKNYFSHVNNSKNICSQIH